MSAPQRSNDATTTLNFMARLGQAFLACGEQTAKVELSLRRIASAFGLRGCRVVSFPTVIFISVQDDDREHVTLIEGPTQSLRLDQIAEVVQLGECAQRGEIDPGDGLRQLGEIWRKPARFGTSGVILGNTILAIGVSMILVPSPNQLVAAAILGVVVGILKAFTRNQSFLAVPIPVAAAALVAALVAIGVDRGWLADPLRALVPPLVTFLPGALLTLGMVELAYGDMVSGASRLLTGVVQLILLAFGVTAGAVLTGYQLESLASVEGGLAIAPWIPWAGVSVFAVGATLHFSAPRNSFVWMLVVLFLAFTAQRLAVPIFGHEISGFFGMLVATPLGYLIQLRFGGPPAMVTFLPTFWLLVPGGLSLLTVKSILSDRVAGLDALLSVSFVFASIALGTLMGASLYKWLTERFNWWQLQIGRVGSYFRKRRKS